MPHGVFLKSCADVLAGPLQALFNKSLQQSHFPKASRTDMNNYIPMIFDSIVTDFVSANVMYLMSSMEQREKTPIIAN